MVRCLYALTLAAVDPAPSADARRFRASRLLYYLWHRASVARIPGLFREVPRQDAVGAAFVHADRLLLRFGWRRKKRFA